MARRYKTSWTTHRGVKRFHVTFDGPITPPITDPAEDLRTRIAEQQKFIADFPNYPTLCAEAQARINFYMRQLAELNPVTPSESDTLQEWMEKNWDQIPEIPFGN